MSDHPDFVFHDLRGRTVVLTGAAWGIGRALVPLLLGQGLNLLLVDKDGDQLSRNLEALGAQESRVTAFVGDLASSSDRKGLAQEIMAHTDTVDGIIHNAAIDPRMPLDRMSVEFFRKVMATNVEPAVELTRDLLPNLKRSAAGRIILMGSVTFDLGTALLSAYVASKGAVVGLTRALAHELGPHGITVNCIEPGAIQVEKEATMYTADTERIILAAQSLKRRLTPKDLGGTVCLLLSNAGVAINGQCIAVNGGLVHPMAAGSLQECMIDE